MKEMIVMVDSNSYQWTPWNTKNLATSCWPLLQRLSWYKKKMSLNVRNTILVCVPERTDSSLNPGAGYPVFSVWAKKCSVRPHGAWETCTHTSWALIHSTHILSVSGGGSPASLGMSLAVQPKVWWSAPELTKGTELTLLALSGDSKDRARKTWQVIRALNYGAWTLMERVGFSQTRGQGDDLPLLHSAGAQKVAMLPSSTSGNGAAETLDQTKLASFTNSQWKCLVDQRGSLDVLGW